MPEALHLAENLLAKLVEDLLLVVGRNLVELQALAHGLDNTVLLEIGKVDLLVLGNLVADGALELVDGVVAKALLGKLVIKLGRGGALDALDRSLGLVGVLVALLAVLVLDGPGEVDNVAHLGASECLLDLVGNLAVNERERLALARELLGALDVLDVGLHDVTLLGSLALGDVLVGGVVGHVALDLCLDLGVGDLLGRHVDLGRVVGVELSLGANANGDVDGVVLALLGEVGVLGKIRTANRDDVELLEHEGLGGVEKVVGSLGEHRILAQDAVNHGTGSVTTTEALEVVLVREVLVGLLDSRVDVGGGNGELCGNLVVLGLLSGDGDLQRSSSVSSSAGGCPSWFPAHVADVVRAKGLEPSRGLPHWNLNPARLPVPPRPHGHT